LLEERGGLTIGVTPSQAGSIAIFRYLTLKYALPLHVDYRFAHTSEMISSAVGIAGEDQPDGFVFSIASWALLQAKTRRSPVVALMIMPSASHRVVAPSETLMHADLLLRGRYMLMSDFPTTPRFYFEDLQRSGRISRPSMGVEHADPNETMRQLAEPGSDIRAVLWFPHDVFSVLLHGCAVLDSRNRTSLPIDNLLVISDEVARNTEILKLLDIAIRDAWLTLMAKPHELARTVNFVLSEGRYIDYLARFSGVLNSRNDGVASAARA